MHYDVIGKVETSKEDMNYIIGKVRHILHENKGSKQLKSGCSESENFKGKVALQACKLIFVLLFQKKMWLTSCLQF